MAGQTGATTATVEFIRALENEPYRFDMFRTLRRLECLYRSRPRLGESRHPAEDPLRLGQEPSLAFAPSPLASFAAGDEGRPSRLAVFSFGLCGPNGPLPLHLTEYARDRERNSDDPTFRRFLDLFHHRMMSLFYRAWANAEPAVSFDRPETDRFALYIGALFGLAGPALRRRDAMPDLAKLHYSGLLGCHTKHAAGLEAILGDFFKIPAVIEQFIGRWIELPQDARWRLGEDPETGSLGRASTIGAQVWDGQGKFRVSLGPLSLADYRRMLPGGDSLMRLAAVLRNFIGDELDWDVKLILNKNEVPPMVLGGTGRLGRTTWLAGRTFEKHADDLVLYPLAGEFANG